MKRFLTLVEVAEVLNISAAQTYALVRNQELPAVKIGGRGVWRVEQAKLDEYIERLYADTSRFIHEHPFAGGVEAADLEESEPPTTLAGAVEAADLEDQARRDHPVR